MDRSECSMISKSRSHSREKKAVGLPATAMLRLCYGYEFLRVSELSLEVDYMCCRKSAVRANTQLYEWIKKKSD